jgi:hypothetical protein
MGSRAEPLGVSRSFPHRQPGFDSKRRDTQGNLGEDG